jgi:hypothetical protein
MKILGKPKRMFNEFGLPFPEDGSIISVRNVDNYILKDTASRLGIS